jgi:para-aminobenzoate synthetase component 1
VWEDIDEDLDEINLQSEDHESKVVSVEIKQRISKKSTSIKSLKMLHHIQQGDLYEANFYGILC